MVFKKLLGALGVGGPTVDTVLSTPVVRPGGSLQGQVHLVGGTQDAEITGITLTLVGRVEVEHEEGEHTGLSAFARFAVSAPFRLAAGEQRSVPFSVTVPYETPITSFAGWQLPGMAVGVRTELEISGARDKSDADPLGVAPLPVQQRVLDAFTALGFRLHSADLEAGHIRDSAQRLPFYQEIEFAAAPQYAGVCKAVELTFLTGETGTEVVLEFDKRGGDVIHRHRLEHTAGDQDLTAVLEGWLQQVAAGYGAHGHGGHGGHGHDGGHGHGGHGFGSAAAGAAAGLVGGLVLGEVAEELFEDFFEG
ncbi:sporulation protein [Kitasatospora sp. NPDC094015]|uniref:sporulation protein n=1 Tax=Kitasatospora sp. NPDC094015 TaxID=3155205 RepID=UPI0033299405